MSAGWREKAYRTENDHIRMYLLLTVNKRFSVAPQDFIGSGLFRQDSTGLARRAA
jgi:hypothetical protein